MKSHKRGIRKAKKGGGIDGTRANPQFFPFPLWGKFRRGKETDPRGRSGDVGKKRGKEDKN